MFYVIALVVVVYLVVGCVVALCFAKKGTLGGVFDHLPCIGVPFRLLFVPFILAGERMRKSRRTDIDQTSSQKKLIYIAKRVSRPLEEEDERYAQSLAVLERKFGDFSVIDEEIKKIGKRLADNGGLERMQLVIYRAHAIDRNVDMDRISGLWHGIGEWLC